MALLFSLLYTFILIGCFSFGGGYAMISFIQKEVVFKHAWITVQEFTNMIAISQATPGPIAVNTATYVGFKMAGIPGAIVATLGLAIPALVIIIALVKILNKGKNNLLVNHAMLGLRPMTVALILGSAVLLGTENILGIKDAIICLLALVLTTGFKINPIFIILAFGVLGIIFG